MTPARSLPVATLLPGPATSFAQVRAYAGPGSGTPGYLPSTPGIRPFEGRPVRYLLPELEAEA
jgi:hypothetical protein